MESKVSGFIVENRSRGRYEFRPLSESTPQTPMPKKNTEAEIQALVDTFVAELSGLIQRSAVEAAMEALSGSLGAPVKRGPGRPRKTAAPATPKATATAPKKRSKRGRRSSKSVARMAERALQYVKSHPDCSVGEMGRALNTTTKELRLPLMKLTAENLIHTVGQKRGTRYRPGAGSARKAAPRKKAAKKATRRRKKK